MQPFLNTDYSHPANDKIDNRTLTAPVQISHTNSSVVFNIVKDADNDDRLGVTASGEPWDGTLTFQWDASKRVYRSRRTVISDIRAFEVADPVGNIAAVDKILQIEFFPYESSRPRDGFAVLSNSGPTQTLATAPEANGNEFAPRLRVNIIAGNTKLEENTYWYGMPAYRIRVGSDIALPGPPRSVVNNRSYDEGSSLWKRFRNIQQDAIIQEIMYQSVNEDSSNDIAGMDLIYAAAFPQNGSQFPNIGEPYGIFNSGANGLTELELSRFGPITSRELSKIHGMALGWYDINRTISGQNGGVPNIDPFTLVQLSGAQTQNPDVVNQYGVANGRCDLFEMGLYVKPIHTNPSDYTGGIVTELPDPPGTKVKHRYNLPKIEAEQENADGSGYLTVVHTIEMYSSEKAAAFYAVDAAGNPDYTSHIWPQGNYASTKTNQDSLTDKIDPDGNVELHYHGKYLNGNIQEYPGTYITAPMRMRIVPLNTDLTVNNVPAGYEYNEEKQTEPFMCVMDLEKVGFQHKGDARHHIGMQCRNELRMVHEIDSKEGTLEVGAETFTIANHATDYFAIGVQSIPTSTKMPQTLVAEGMTAPQAAAAYLAAHTPIHNAYAEYARQGNCFKIPDPGAKHHVIRVLDNGEVLIPNMVLPYFNPTHERAFLLTFQTKNAVAGKRFQRVFYFSQEQISEVIMRRRENEIDDAHTYSVYTHISNLYRRAAVGADFRTRDPSTAVGAETTAGLNTLLAGNTVDVFITILPNTLSNLFFDKYAGEYDRDKDVFAYYKTESLATGPVYRSKKRISQHVCAPILNPNKRLGCIAPLNYESRHLPPEMRDFRLRLGDVNFDFLESSVVTVQDLILYQFNGGNQVQTAEPSMMYLPQFREYKSEVTSGTFDFECRTNYGLPSFFCIFCRDKDEFDWQPLIQRLSISSTTTMKKSDVIFETDVELYHMTQRNVHPHAEYDHRAFNKRQVILLATEDIGTVGLAMDIHYQKSKRAGFRIAGTVNRPGTVTVIFIYNNRGLAIQGRQLAVVRF